MKKPESFRAINSLPFFFFALFSLKAAFIKKILSAPVSPSQNYSYTHLSAGDLLRGERAREGSEFGQLIDRHIKDGEIVPVEITINLLRKVCASRRGEDSLMWLRPLDLKKPPQLCPCKASSQMW